jgi:hypothetical protein
MRITLRSFWIKAFGVKAVVIAAAVGALGLAAAPRTAAHCDSLDGPVVKAAKRALDTADVTPTLKWVRETDEEEIRRAFADALSVREMGPKARELADTHFFETLVRVHRFGEGAPYTGLRPAGSAVEPGIAAADVAVESGSPEALVQQMSEEIAAGIRRRFARVSETSQHADESVAAGRAYVEAYVDFIHYVERLHEEAGAHHGAEASAAPHHSR